MARLKEESGDVLRKCLSSWPAVSATWCSMWGENIGSRLGGMVFAPPYAALKSSFIYSAVTGTMPSGYKDCKGCLWFFPLCHGLSY